ncbi:MAG: hypothetical protein NTX79_01065 [Candidatus Micrarchaeota archaeon]|nr:hypothetical protein [Candidatus Micrarchaeota archaeon]
MQESIPHRQHAAPDFVGAYEKAMQEVISGCGSRQAANGMIGELQRHYERTAAELKKAGESVQARGEILSSAKMEANRIIEKYAPNTGNHFHELVISYSFGAIMLTIPLVAAASLLTVATGILAAGSAYFISAKILGNWKGMVARRRISDLSGVVGPKNIRGLPRMLGAKGKK